MARERSGREAWVWKLVSAIFVCSIGVHSIQRDWLMVILTVLAALIVAFFVTMHKRSQILPGQDGEAASEPSVQLDSDGTMNSEFHSTRLGEKSQQSFEIPKPPASFKKVAWIKAGEPVTVAGLTLPGGLLYVGDRVSRSKFFEPSLIDISLKVASTPVSPGLMVNEYWPWYADISQEERRRYLQWHAEGRCDPRAGIGYVFMFFYGLERRALIDARNDPDAQLELPIIEEEVRRLLQVYHSDYSFRGYASRFLDCLQLPGDGSRLYERDPVPPSALAGEMPLNLQIALGQMAVDRVPLNADWALSWALNDPNISRRTAVIRCASQFADLFRAEFQIRHRKGINLPNNKTRLKTYYRAASNGLSPLLLEVGDLPNIMVTSATRNKLQALVDHCTLILDPYSRYLGRNPHKDGTFEASLLLPVELWSAQSKAALDSLRNEVASQTLILNQLELLSRFSSDVPLNRDQLGSFSRTLESLNIGVEPDVLSGAKTPKPGDMLALFSIGDNDGQLRADDAYNAAVITLDLASAVAAADGEASTEGAHLLTSHIDSWSQLSIAQRKRLKARLSIQLRQPPTLASLKKKLEPFGREAKSKLAGFLAHLAQVDGVVTPQEVKLLERVYKALGLDPQTLYGDLHAAAARAPQLDVSFATGEQRESEVSVRPVKPVTAGAPVVAGEFALDMGRIAQLQRETAEVSALLANVFVDESPVEPVVEPATESQEDDVGATDATVYGLDIDHSAFLRLLVTKNEWSRAELEDVASDMDLMLDGALERINDMAFDRFDMPFSEGDDPVEINPDVLEELSL